MSPACFFQLEFARGKFQMQLLSCLCRKGNAALQGWKGLGSKAYPKFARRTSAIVYHRARTTVESG